jgi:hypothetical protein
VPEKLFGSRPKAHAAPAVVEAVKAVAAAVVQAVRPRVEAKTTPTGDPWYRAERADGKARWIPKRKRWLRGDGR